MILSNYKGRYAIWNLIFHFQLLRNNMAAMVDRLPKVWCYVNLSYVEIDVYEVIGAIIDCHYAAQVAYMALW